MNLPVTLTILLLLNVAVGAQAQPMSPSQGAPVETKLDVGGDVSFDVNATEFPEPLTPAAEHNAAVYNFAVGLYRDGDYLAAANAFARAASDDDRSLAAKARFNLGNCFYAQALRHLEAGDDPATAVNELQTAIMHYRSVLRLAPDDEDARVNLELATRILDQLTPPEEPEAPDQPPQVDESQENQTEQDQTEENQQPQPSDAGQEPESERATNEDSSEEAEPSAEGESEDETESSGDETAEPGTDPSSGSEPSETESPMDESTSDESQSTGESSAESVSGDAAAADDQDATEATSQPTGNQHSDSAGTEPEPPLPTERTPEGKLEAADNPADDQASEIGDPSAVNVTDAGQRMTQQEAMKMLQSVRDRDMIRRYRREAAKRSRYIPVERDW